MRAPAVHLQDARLLRAAVREAVRTSPDSFITTLHNVDAKRLDYWLNELSSATWVVAQCEGATVGVAAAKPPNLDLDKEDQETTRYIESVWVAPDFRRRGLGQRLIEYLLATEYRRNENIKQFLLWVFATNANAIKLYEHMGFNRTPEKHVGTETEMKYRLDFDAATRAAVAHAGSDAAFWEDGRQYEVSYRVLGEQSAAEGG
jgi:ribosomal protein S18 acetylase RimI-like enzyme